MQNDYESLGYTALTVLTEPKSLIPVVPDEIYAPEDLHLLHLSSPSSAVLPSAAGQKAVTELCDVRGMGTKVRAIEEDAEEEEVVPMDLASSPFPHRSPEPSKGAIHHPSTPPPQNEPPVEPKKYVLVFIVNPSFPLPPLISCIHG